MRKKTRIWISPLILGLVLILVDSCKKDDNKPGPTTTDIDGNVYHSVTIGTQVWMVENLKVTKLNDGTAILNVTDDTGWANLTAGAYCWHNNDPGNKEIYGALYNFYAVNSGKLAPTGWHVPTDAEWATLTTFLGGETVAGGKLKESGTVHWTTPNTDATNASGFTALPGSNRNYLGSFQTLGEFGTWWSSTGSGATAIYRFLASNSGSINSNTINKPSGFSVRCIKD